MAIFRKIHTTFWSDSFVSELKQEYKLFYIYLLTNERTKQCGIYEITKRQIHFDLGYSIDRVSILLEYFISADKIMYNDQTNEIAIKNWDKYNGSTSPKVKSCINKELKDVKDTVLIQYIYSIDTASQQEQEQEEEKEQQQENKNVIFLNDCLSNQEWIDVVSMQNGKMPKWVKDKLPVFERHLFTIDEVKNNVRDFKSHFINWMKKQKQTQTREISL